MVNLIDRWRRSIRTVDNIFVVFLPGLLFLLIGLAALVVPQLVVAIISGFFLFFGVIFCYLAWKLMNLRKALKRATKGFEGRIQIVAVNPQPNQTVVTEIDKKIVYH